MKRLLPLALCALFALDAGARTLYVHASRPNNSGSGLSAKKAKKTIQAAVNIARKGDTILVDYGTYSSFKTKNKKIKIKSIEGCYETRIRRSRTKSAAWCMNLAKWNGSACAGGTATSVWGFRCLGAGLKGDKGSWGVVGGTLRSCEFADFHVGSRNLSNRWKTKKPVFWKARLVDSILLNCYQNTEFNDLMLGCTVQRCRIVNCSSRIRSSKLVNTFVGGRSRRGKTDYNSYSGRYGKGMIADDEFYDCAWGFRDVTWPGDNGSATRYGCFFQGSKLYNCTVVHGNSGRFTKFFKGSKAWNTIFWKVPSSIFSKRKSLKNSFSHCYEGGPDPGFVQTDRKRNPGYWEDGYYIEEWFSNPDFTLEESSPCIDAGLTTAKMKRIVGTGDCNGAWRVSGQRIDIGCFEY